MVILLAPFVPARFGRAMRGFARFWGWISLKLALCKVTVIDAHKIKEEAGVIISNHQSPFDIFIGCGYYPVDFLFFSKKEIFAIPLIGMAMRKLEYISVDRSNPQKAASSLLASASKIRKGGHRVLVYPEGTRNAHPHELLKFKPGSLRMAAMAEVPLMPIVIYGTAQAKPVNRSFYLKPTHLAIKVLDPIRPGDPLHPSTAANDKEKERDQLEKLRQLIQKEYLALAETFG